MFRTSDNRLEVDVKFKYEHEHEHEKFNFNKFKMFVNWEGFLCFVCVLLLLNVRYSICARLCLYIVHETQ